MANEKQMQNGGTPHTAPLAYARPIRDASAQDGLAPDVGSWSDCLRESLKGCAFALLGGTIGFFGTVVALMLIIWVVVLVTQDEGYTVLSIVLTPIPALGGLLGLLAGPSFFRRVRNEEERGGFPVIQRPIDIDGSE